MIQFRAFLNCEKNKNMFPPKNLVSKVIIEMSEKKIVKEANEKIKKILRNYNASASDSSLKIYAGNISSFIREMDGDLENPDASCFRDVGKIEELMNTQKLLINTKKNKVSAIISFLSALGASKKLIKEYSKKIEEYTLLIDKENLAMEWNDKEKNNLESVAELSEYMNLMKSKLPEDPKTFKELHRYMMYLSGAFHLKYPLRNELSDTKIFYDKDFDPKDMDDDTNYLVISGDTAKMYLNKYKTKKTYGLIEFDVDDHELVKMFSKYYDAIVKFIPADYFDNWLLFKLDYGKMSRNSFTQLLQRTFSATGKKISSSMIRKMVVSELYPVDKLKKLSNIMGHSVKTAITDYVRN